MWMRFAIRDSVIVAAAVAAWQLLAFRSAGSGAGADLAGLVAGLLVGAAGFVLHEWGHLVAGVLSGGTVRINANLRSGFLFSFDAEQNTLKQFVVMSLGGFAVTAVLVWLVYAVLPDGLLASRVARGAAVFLALLTLVLEVPLLAYALVRGGVPSQAAVKVQAPAAETPPARAAA